MATYYWVGGAGTWSASATANWSLSSGGSGSAGVPTSADDVVFDSNSNIPGSGATFNVNLSSGVCRNLTVTGPGVGNVVFATNGGITVSGNLTLPATGFAVTNTPIISLNASTSVNITTNGSTLATLNITGTGTFTLQTALTCGTFTHSNGSFVTNNGTNNYNVTTSGFNSTGSTSRSMTLGSSVITANGAFTLSGSNLTFSGASSTISCWNSISGLGNTFGDVTILQGGAISSPGAISGANTFTNLIISYGAALTSDVATTNVTGTQTITGTFTVTSTAENKRNWIKSSTAGTQASINVVSPGTVSLTDVIFSDINATGVALSGTRIGDAGNNTNVTASTARTVYWSTLSGSNDWYANGWAITSSSTAPAAQYLPLPQDTAIIDNTSAATTISVAATKSALCGTLDMSSRSSAMTLSIGNAGSLYMFGDLKIGTGLTMTGVTSTSLISFGNRSSSSITTNGVSVGPRIFVDAITGAVSLSDPLTQTSTSGGFAVVSGTFNTNNNTLSTTIFNSANTNTRTINLGTSTVAVSNTAGWALGTTTGLTFNGSSSTISVTFSTASGTFTFAGGSLAYGTLAINSGSASGQIFTITGSNTFSNITTNKTVAWTLNFTAGTTTTFSNWSLSGSAGNLITVKSATNAGHTLVYTGTTYVSADYLNISYSNAKPSNYEWFAGANSTNSGNNTGWWFSTPITGGGGNMFLLF